MRRVGLSDLDLATRTVLAMSQEDWDVHARSLIEGAHAADLWRKRYGRAHPDGGTGSLYAQASLYPRAASRMCSQRYCAALQVVLRALNEWRHRDL